MVGSVKEYRAKDKVDLKDAPTIFTVERVVAAAPKKLTLGLLLCASKWIPPRAVVPEIAFVTAIRGECKECVTPRTTWTPMILLSANVVSMEENAGFGAHAPMAKTVADSAPTCLAPWI